MENEKLWKFGRGTAINPSQKIVSRTEEYETCIVCGNPLDILKSNSVYLREHYVRGCGQLCADCYTRMMRLQEQENDKQYED